MINLHKQLNLIVCDTKGKAEIQIGLCMWKLTIPLGTRKAVTLPANNLTQITLQPKWTSTSYNMQLDFHGRTIISVDPAHKQGDYFLVVVKVKWNICIVIVKNKDSKMISFRPGKTIAYLDYRSKGCLYHGSQSVIDNILTMQKHIYIVDRMLCDTLSPEAMQKQLKKEGDILPHIAIQADTYVNDTNKAMTNDQYIPAVR